MSTKNAAAGSVDDATSALHVFRRALDLARALGRPGGARGKQRRKDECLASRVASGVGFEFCDLTGWRRGALFAADGELIRA